MSRIYPNDDTVQNDFGISPANDLRNRSMYGRVGFGLDKVHDSWSFTTSYYFQKYFRDELDTRIELSQSEVYDYNHVVSASVSRRVTNNLKLSTQLEYHLHRYLDEIPVLYTRLTSERFADNAVFFSVGLTYRLKH